jgi:glycosyltransferase involved in cell wall biosynthesis
MSKSAPKFLFLYSELAGYMLSCIKLLAETKGVDVCIIRWPINKEAPFQFDFPKAIKVYEKSDFTFPQLKQLVKEFNPDLIYTSGWMDKEYTKICRFYRKSIPIITAFDNKWTGSLKQQIASKISPFTIHKCFSHCFVPGDLQLKYALKLGFKRERILQGLYSADVAFFNRQFYDNKATKEKMFPKRFIYVGRYYSFKGIEDLWQAFSELHMEATNEWELWCFGTGNLEPFKHPKIKHFGFVQPEEQKKYIAQTGIFVLPSRFEPWAVVAHEYAAAGFPLLLSSEVGARTKFLEEGKNGFPFQAGNVGELKDKLKSMMNLSDEEKNKMGERSNQLAQQITPQLWVERIYNVLNQ